MHYDVIAAPQASGVPDRKLVSEDREHETPHPIWAEEEGER